MMKFIKGIFVASLLICVLCCTTGCTTSASYQDRQAQMQVANKLVETQPTPTDIDYSLERYNLIRRAYWVNGQREKADTLICQIEKPMSYVTLFAGNAMVGSFVVDGKVSSLNSFLTPDSEYYSASYSSRWLADVDGSYGENDSGIFFFTVNGNYIEWTGTYLYSDIPFIVENPIVTYKESDTNE